MACVHSASSTQYKHSCVRILCGRLMLQVHQVVPYLLRRASENASIMKGAKRDVQLLVAELKRRAVSTIPGSKA